MFETIRSGPWVVRRLRDEVDRVFSNLAEGSWIPDLHGFLAGGTYPPVNLWETEAAVVVELEVPGLTLADLEVLVVGNELTVKGQRKDTAVGEAPYHRRERMVGEFTRSIQVPLAVAPDKVEALLKDGILTVTLPKDEATKPRKIAIRG